MLNLSELLPSVIAISQQAGAAIMAIYSQPEQWQVQHKSDTSPLTAADLASHQLIEHALQQLTPDIPVLSEESDDMTQRHHWPRLWVVDPLDGTKEFVHRTDDFVVCIALVVEGKAVLGVVYAPVSGVTYAAFVEGGAWRVTADGQQQPIHSAVVTNTPNVLLSRNHQGGKEGQVLANISARFGDYASVNVGSALKMCRVAEGAADFYPRLGPTMEWDTAAAQIIVEEAGGVLVNNEGQALSYNQRDTLTNGNFFVIGDKSLIADWLACVNG